MNHFGEVVVNNTNAIDYMYVKPVQSEASQLDGCHSAFFTHKLIAFSLPCGALG